MNHKEPENGDEKTGKPTGADDLLTNESPPLPPTPTHLMTQPVGLNRIPDPTAAPSRRASDDSPRYGRFALQRLHAKGGLGEVLVALDEELKRDVALKRMQERCAHNPAARRRFLNEAEITARLEHPGIVPIYGLVQDEHGRPCYAMRFIEGESLAEAIKKFHIPDEPPGLSRRAGGDKNRRSSDCDSLAFRQLLQRFISVCQTMAYAHSKLVIHRDIKPANIMLGPFGETLVVDWGLAREIAVSGPQSAVSEEEAVLPSTIQCTPSPSDDRIYTQAGQSLGTPGYMSPEQAAGRWSVVGPCSDIWSLGATLYELLTGMRPIRGQDILEALQKAQAGDFPAPWQVNADVPKALEAVCLKAMALKPEQRYATAKDLAHDLEHWLADEPVSAWEEPWTIRLRRWGRRHRAMVSSGVVAALLGIAALTGITFLERQHAAVVEAQRNELAERNEALDLAHQREHKLADLGQRTIEAMTDEKAIAALRTARGLTDAQKGWLRQAVNYYAEVTAETATNEAARLRQAKAYGRMGLLQSEFGEKSAAEQANRRALEVSEKLAADFPSVPQYRRDIAAGHVNLGGLHSELGQLPTAEQEYRRAADIYEKLAREFATNPQYQNELSTTRSSLGNVLVALGQQPKAEKEFHSAIDIQEKLTAEFPAIQHYRFILARSHNNLGAMLAEMGDSRSAEAEQEYRKALEIREKLAADFPHILQYRMELGGNHHNLGRLLESAGQLSAAEVEYRQALEIQEKLATEFPAVAQFRAQLAVSCINFGSLLAGQEQPKASLVWYAKAVTLLEPLVRQEPRLVRERIDLCKAYWASALALAKLDRHDEAIKDWEQALATNALPEQKPLFRRNRAISLARVGDHAKAVAEANALAESSDVTGDNLYNLSRVFAIASVAVKEDAKLTEQYAARAVELLRQAVAKGYQDIEHLKQDDDLKPLREREDYKKLAKELEKILD